jgi:putative membrane protein
MSTRSLAICVAIVAFFPALTGAVSAASSAPPYDEQFLKTSVQGDIFEIQGGKMAQRRSHSSQVTTLAKRLIKDHAKSLNDAKAVAQKLGIQLELQPMPSMQWELKAVASMSGKKFDHWYSTLEVYDHQQDIKETEDEIANGQNAEIQKLAKQDLPVLQKHLKLARQAASAS